LEAKRQADDVVKENDSRFYKILKFSVLLNFRQASPTRALAFSDFASHKAITHFALNQLFKASFPINRNRLCKQTLVGRFHHLICSCEMPCDISQGTRGANGVLLVEMTNTFVPFETSNFSGFDLTAKFCIFALLL
jgi:hypothetical protein